MERRVAYIYDERLNRELDKVEVIRKRSRLVNELVFSYGLVSHLTIFRSKIAREDELLSFHSQLYIDFMKTINCADDIEKHEQDGEEYGLGYDCPIVEGIYDFALAVVGSSLTAANILVEGKADVAINWYGGWHHAQRDEAAGFCYVNDIVCGIHKLLERFNRILYIDLDIHHGDGVENAFVFSRKVLTLSFHKFELGFYPGSGSLSDVGLGNGRFYSVNVPLKEGICDVPYTKVFDRVASAVHGAFEPDAVVVQCGADCLSGDPLGAFNVTLKGIGHCVQHVLSWKEPLMFVGGGGYNLSNTARCWTYITSLIVQHEISNEIPDNKYLLEYGPGYDLEITASLRPDRNTAEYLQECITTALDNVQKIKEAA